MRIAIIGKGFAGLNRYLEKNGDEYVIFKDAKKLPLTPKEHTTYIDFSDENKVFENVSDAHKESPFDGILTIYEQYIVITARLAEVLGLPGLPVEAAHACTDKTVMRSMFAQAPKKISPDFQPVRSWDEVEHFAQTHTFPLILKPANLAKSLLVTKNNSLEELHANYQKMMDRIEPVYQKYAPHNERLVLIEEFLEGSIHSVDAYIDGDGQPHILPHIVDYQTGYDIGFDDNFHYSRILPSKLPAGIQRDFLETAEIGIKALGMRNSAAHIEIIVTADGPRIVEIGARNGGYRERMHKAAQGIDVYGNLLRIITDQPVDARATKNEPCAVLELFPKIPGIFAAISEEEAARALPSLEYLSVKYKLGEFAGKSSDGYKAACVIALHHASAEQFSRDLAFVNQHVHVETTGA